MARAKRTERADARRRYRQAAVVDPDAVELDDVTVAAPEPASKAVRHPAPASGASGARMGFTDAMRVAWHRPDIRADLAALPSLLVGRWFLIPLGLVVGSTLAVAVAPSAISALLFQTLVYPPAMAPVFVVGFFAKRASYLLGLIIGVVDTLVFVLYVYAIAPHISTVPIDAVAQQQALVSAVTVGPLAGILFAAGAAWYRRFLQLSSRQRPSQQSRGKGSGQQRTKASRPARG